MENRELFVLDDRVRTRTARQSIVLHLEPRPDVVLMPYVHLSVPSRVRPGLPFRIDDLERLPDA